MNLVNIKVWLRHFPIIFFEHEEISLKMMVGKDKSDIPSESINEKLLTASRSLKPFHFYKVGHEEISRKSDNFLLRNDYDTVKHITKQSCLFCVLFLVFSYFCWFPVHTQEHSDHIKSIFICLYVLYSLRFSRIIKTAYFLYFNLMC